MNSPCGYKREDPACRPHGGPVSGREVFRLYPGEGLLRSYLLFKETRTGVDPLGSDNPLIFVSCLIAGLCGEVLSRFSGLPSRRFSKASAQSAVKALGRCTERFGVRQAGGSRPVQATGLSGNRSQLPSLLVAYSSKRRMLCHSEN